MVRTRLFRLFVGTLFLNSMGCLPSVENGADQASSASTSFNGALSASALSANQIEVKWNAPSSGQPIGAFQVFQVKDDSSLVSLSISSGDSLSYVHGGLFPGQSYRYIVRGLYSNSTEDKNFRIVTAQTPDSSGPSGLTLSPSSKTLSFAKLFTFTALNGVSPYTYSVLSGPGSINPVTGEFVSLSSEGVVTLRVQDASGSKAYASVSVVKGFELWPQTRQLKFNRSLELELSGAVHPVTYEITSGSTFGSVSSAGVFTAGSLPGTATIRVTDSSGLFQESVISVVDQMIPHDDILISTSDHHACYSKKGQSQFFCWGRGFGGTLANPEGEVVGDHQNEFGDQLAEIDLGPFVITDIRSDWEHTCVLFSNGKMKCWGNASHGRLLSGSGAVIGDNPGEVGPNLNFLNFGTGRTVKSFGLGANWGCALLDNDLVKCWGYNYYGSLGNGTQNSLGDSTNEVGDLLPYVDLGPGRTVKKLSVNHYYNSCAILDNDLVKCWGYNAYGQLGYGDTNTRGDEPNEMGANLPYVDLGTGRTAVDVFAGDKVSCALLDNGDLKCWGYNTYGNLGQGDTIQRGDGPGEMGDNLAAIDLGTGRSLVDLTLGSNHMCGLFDDQKIRCWGYGGEGRNGNGVGGYIGDQAGEMGDNLIPVNLGFDLNGNPYIPVKVRAGIYHTCAIMSGGEMKCWGNSGSFRLPYGSQTSLGDNPSELGNNLPVADFGVGRTVKQVGPGAEHTCVALDNNKVKCWGVRFYGRLGDGLDHRGDAPGELLSYPISSFGSDPIEKIEVGALRSCAQLQNGKIKCWGYGTEGGLGNGSSTHVGDHSGEIGSNTSEVSLGSGLTLKQFSYGSSHGCAVFTDGRAKCWGNGVYGGTGLGAQTDLGDAIGEVGDNLPFLDLGPGFEIDYLVAGHYANCAISTNQVTKCWGYNGGGNLGLGDTANRGDDPGEMGANLPAIDLGTNRYPKKLALGNGFACAILDNDDVKCWGSNSYGRLGYGDNVIRGNEPNEMGDNLPAVDLGSHGFKPIDIVVSYYAACVLFSNEKVKCWGHPTHAATGHGGSMGDGPNEMGDQLPFINLGNQKRVVKLSESGSVSESICAVLDDASIKCWGENDFGELGLGNLTNVGENSVLLGDALPALVLPF